MSYYKITRLSRCRSVAFILCSIYCTWLQSSVRNCSVVCVQQDVAFCLTQQAPVIASCLTSCEVITEFWEVHGEGIPCVQACFSVDVQALLLLYYMVFFPCGQVSLDNLWEVHIQKAVWRNIVFPWLLYKAGKLIGGCIYYSVFKKGTV